jgi:hypothetical protein
MIQFIIHKYFITNFLILRRTGELHVTDLQMICHQRYQLPAKKNELNYGFEYHI